MGKAFYKTIFFKISLGVIFFIVTTLFAVAYWLWIRIYTPNILVGGDAIRYILIPTGSDFKQLKDTLYGNHLIKDRKSFEWVAEKKNFTGRVKGGRYAIAPNMNNSDFIDLLRSGKQTPINLTINNIRTKEMLSGRIAKELELDSIDLITLLNDPVFLSSYQKKPETALSLFIPNTYQFFWNTDAEAFVMRMKKEYDTFWDNERTEKLRKIGLSADEAVILASIVQEETNKNDEKQRIAGVYMNRLQSSWPLQADPTLKFALGDFTIRRVLTEHKNIDSPYNTYKNIGLPPGPICMPDIASVDAVLNYERHGYYYFCAKDDLSGYHVFATNLAEHNINARKYHNALNRLRIYK